MVNCLGLLVIFSIGLWVLGTLAGLVVPIILGGIRAERLGQAGVAVGAAGELVAFVSGCSASVWPRENLRRSGVSVARKSMETGNTSTDPAATTSKYFVNVRAGTVSVAR